MKKTKSTTMSKKLFATLPIVMLIMGTYACKSNTYVHHHSVRMVDAKSYMDHPVSVSLYYYQ